MAIGWHGEVGLGTGGGMVECVFCFVWVRDGAWELS